MNALFFAELAGAAFFLTGSGIVAAAGVGLIRFTDPFMRMHAATKAGVVGAGLVMLGVGVATGTVGGALTGLAGLVFLLATAPIASHVLGRAAYIAGAPISPTTVQDALAGILPRNVHDIDPARTVRRPRGRKGTKEEGAMTAVEQIRSEYPSSAGIAADPHTLRKVTAWLVGGDCQDEALGVAFDLARDCGSALTGLTAIDHDAGYRRRAVPAGGGYWATWQAGQRRQRMRDQAATALSGFNQLSADTGVPGTARHEEGDLSKVSLALAGADLLVVPADVDQCGAPAAYRDELASLASAARLAPVLRVRRKPTSLGRVALLVDGGPGSRAIAQSFLKTGMYPHAAITVLPIGRDPAITESLAHELADLLEAHGRDVTVSPPIDHSDEAFVMVERLRPFDLVAMNRLSARTGWFSHVREDAHEVAADTAPLVLLI